MKGDYLIGLQRATDYRPSCSRCSLCCSVSRWGRGIPHPVLDRGYPIQSWVGGGVAQPVLAWGYPNPVLVGGWGTPGYPPSWAGTWPQMGVPPCPDLGMGYPPSWPGMEYPPLHHKCGQTENITFPHLLDGGGNNLVVHYISPFWRVADTHWLSPTFAKRQLSDQYGYW